MAIEAEAHNRVDRTVELLPHRSERAELLHSDRQFNQATKRFFALNKC